MIPATYNFDPCTVGDTIEPSETFDIKFDEIAQDLTAATIRMMLKNSRGKVIKFFQTGDGITILPDNLRFKIDQFDASFQPGVHVFDIEVEWGTGEKNTYIKGIWPFEKDTTNGY